MPFARLALSSYLPQKGSRKHLFKADRESLRLLAVSFSWRSAPHTRREGLHFLPSSLTDLPIKNRNDSGASPKCCRLLSDGNRSFVVDETELQYLGPVTSQDTNVSFNIYNEMFRRSL
jgi:hypothetical protein